MRSEITDVARKKAREIIKAAETQWRSQDDCGLRVKDLLDLIENRIAAAVTTPLRVKREEIVKCLTDDHVAKFLARLDEEGKSTFNELVRIARIGSAKEMQKRAVDVAIDARDLDGPYEGKQLDCGCDLMIVQHLRAWNLACEHVADAIRALI